MNNYEVVLVSKISVLTRNYSTLKLQNKILKSKVEKVGTRKKLTLQRDVSDFRGLCATLFE